LDLQDVLPVLRQAHGLVPDEIEVLLPALHANAYVTCTDRHADRPLHRGVVIGEDRRAEGLELFLFRLEVLVQNAPAPRPDRDLAVRVDAEPPEARRVLRLRLRAGQETAS